MSKARWPDDVPVLEGGDFCREQANGPAGTHCLGGWVCTAFRCDRQYDVVDIFEDMGIDNMPDYNDDTGELEDAVVHRHINPGREKLHGQQALSEVLESIGSTEGPRTNGAGEHDR